MVKKRVARGTKNPRRFWNIEKIYGEGQYAVVYSVYDSTGHLRFKQVPGNPIRVHKPIERVRRFKTLFGAVKFFEKKMSSGDLPSIFLWQSRLAKIGPIDMETYTYEAVPTLNYDTFDLKRLESRLGRGNVTYEDIIDDVKKELRIFDRHTRR